MLDFQRINIAPQHGNALAVNLENGAIIGTEPIEEYFKLEALSVIPNVSLQWDLPIDFSICNIHLFETTISNPKTLTLNVKNELGEDYISMGLTYSNFNLVGNLSYFKDIPFLLSANDKLEIIPNFSIDTLTLICKRAKFLDKVRPIGQ